MFHFLVSLYNSHDITRWFVIEENFNAISFYLEVNEFAPEKIVIENNSCSLVLFAFENF